MRSATGTGALIRYILRRDRVRLTVCIAVVAGYSALLMDGPLGVIPVLAVVGGFAFAVVALIPRMAWLAWVGIAVVWTGVLGAILGLPDWVLQLSPFGHDPLFPAADLEIVPPLVLAAVAAVLGVAGFYAFQRRDIGVT